MGDYEVGYRKPPESGRIRKGERRNPNGRRGKKAKPPPPDNSVKGIIERLDEETVEFMERQISKREAMIRVVQAKALKGDIQSMKLFEDMRRQAGVGQARPGGGVLVVPATPDLESWSISAAIQQAKFRGEDPDGLARLEAQGFGRPSAREDQEGTRSDSG